ncbi:oxidoreductase [Amnibacterium setariae]|uniref:Oxidoreductase n=1 Tax=Amnibacterium setariae TaxID=2306585 RepID=A0A3A1TZ28_9MICO|nr:oxidoreductase [Amnibacterium setariae]RIX27935.1 oxidoreductase [Amnibacterium setariae]
MTETTNSLPGGTLPGGTYRLGDREVPRVGFGAMQLPGKGVFGPPRDHDEAIAVLRTAVELGIRHIDTADFYGPHVSNELIREALAPYPDDLVIVTKVGSRRDDRGAWIPRREPEDLQAQVHDNLRTLGVDVLDVVNVRVGGGDDAHSAVPGSIAPEVEAVAELQQQGLVRHVGVSTVDAQQVAEARSITEIVEVQNFYNLANRGDDDLIRRLADDGIAYVPYFPLGGFSPLQSGTLDAVAARVGATPMQVAQAWLLQRSPNLLLIPGTSSVAHLRENVAGAGLVLPADAVAELDAIA